MNILFWIALALAVLFVVWRINIRLSGQWVDVPSDPHAWVKPELVPLVDWVAKKAESQIGRGYNISGNTLAMSAICSVVERALAEHRQDGKIEIAVPDFVKDKGEVYGFRVTLSREQLKQFNL